jgi:hypothetical protein
VCVIVTSGAMVIHVQHEWWRSGTAGDVRLNSGPRNRPMITITLKPRRVQKKAFHGWNFWNFCVCVEQRLRSETQIHQVSFFHTITIRHPGRNFLASFRLFDSLVGIHSLPYGFCLLGPFSGYEMYAYIELHQEDVKQTPPQVHESSLYQMNLLVSYLFPRWS